MACAVDNDIEESPVAAVWIGHQLGLDHDAIDHVTCDPCRADGRLSIQVGEIFKELAPVGTFER